MSKANGSERLVRLNTLQVDVEMEEAGQWYPLDGICDGVEVKLRSPHCDDFQRLQGSLQQRQRVFSATGEIDTVALDRIFRRCVGECLLVDWRGLGDADGKAIPWNQELAKDIMRKQVYRKIGAKVAAIVRRIQQDEEVERAEEGKGSEPESDTISNSLD